MSYSTLYSLAPSSFRYSFPSPMMMFRPASTARAENYWSSPCWCLNFPATLIHLRPCQVVAVWLQRVWCYNLPKSTSDDWSCDSNDSQTAVLSASLAYVATECDWRCRWAVLRSCGHGHGLSVINSLRLTRGYLWPRNYDSMTSSCGSRTASVGWGASTGWCSLALQTSQIRC